MLVNKHINSLIDYFLDKGLIEELDVYYVGNILIELLKEERFERLEKCEYNNIEDILCNLCDDASSKGLIEKNSTAYDLFDCKLMNVVTPLPSAVKNNFFNLYSESPKKATDYFYSLSKDVNYIKTKRIEKNICYKENTPYGKLDITINLSKPEKSLAEIEKARLSKATGYPKCLLCYENMGYSGNLNHPARENLRLIPLTLNNEKWYLQYSPYSYYNEHCIVLKETHDPMTGNSSSIRKLVEFCEMFPHYFIGSNAGIPIVGGSILNHDHFQGGNYSFALFEAKVLEKIKLDKFKGLNIEYLYWPLDTLRLEGNEEEVIKASEYIMDMWTEYSDIEHEIYAYTNQIRHNAVTPIVKKVNDKYVIYLILRNNRTDEEHPEGIFHPNRSLHHVKKENIGLIEAAGLAVLPSRLEKELNVLADVLSEKVAISELNPIHLDWYYEIKEKYNSIKDDDVSSIIRKELANKFIEVLECCSVLRFGNKQDNLNRFINYLNNN